MKFLRLFFIPLLVFGALQSCNSDYGEKVEKDKNEVFYKDGATEKDAQNLLDYLVKAKLFQPGEHNSAQILKKDDKFIVKMVVLEEVAKNAEGNEIIKAQVDRIAKSLYGGEEIEFHICDNHFKTLHRIVTNGDNAYDITMFDYNQIMSKHIDISIVQTIGQFLLDKEYFTNETASTVTLEMIENQLNIGLVVKDGIVENEEALAYIKSLITTVNKQLEGDKINVIKILSTKLELQKSVTL